MVSAKYEGEIEYKNRSYFADKTRLSCCSMAPSNLPKKTACKNS